MRTFAVLLGTLVLALVAPSAASADVNFNVRGKWTCKDGSTVTPISGARIELWRDISYWPDDKITSRPLRPDGTYDIGIHAGSNFKLYVKVLLTDDSGVELENWYSPFTWETETGHINSHSGIVDVGTWQISKSGTGTPKCAIWQGAHNAYANYKSVIGSRPPSQDYKIDAEFPCCGTPFTTRDTTRWPEGYTTGFNYSVNFHEFAHSVRHSFDGGTAHFLFDAGRFLYPQNHFPCKVTNQGFAFNEGWAEYWAKSYPGAPCGGSTANTSQEGNVAVELTKLEACSNRPSMVRVLRESPGSIHSLSDFQTRFTQILGPRNCNAPVIGTGTIDPVLSADQLTKNIKAQIAAQKKLIASLSRQAAASKRRARHPGRCIGKRCQAALENLIEPSALSAQMQQAKLVLGRLEDGLAAARKAKFDPSQEIKLTSGLVADRDEFEKANQKILIGGLKKSMKEIETQPGFRRGRRSDLFKTLDNRLNTLTRARKRGKDTPGSVGSLFAAPASPLEGAKRTSTKSK
jgi:hypothetical protein